MSTIIIQRTKQCKKFDYSSMRKRNHLSSGKVLFSILGSGLSSDAMFPGYEYTTTEAACAFFWRHQKKPEHQTFEKCQIIYPLLAHKAPFENTNVVMSDSLRITEIFPVYFTSMVLHLPTYGIMSHKYLFFRYLRFASLCFIHIQSVYMLFTISYRVGACYDSPCPFFSITIIIQLYIKLDYIREMKTCNLLKGDKSADFIFYIDDIVSVCQFMCVESLLSQQSDYMNFGSTSCSIVI